MVCQSLVELVQIEIRLPLDSRCEGDRRICPPDGRISVAVSGNAGFGPKAAERLSSLGIKMKIVG